MSTKSTLEQLARGSLWPQFFGSLRVLTPFLFLVLFSSRVFRVLAGVAVDRLAALAASSAARRDTDRSSALRVDPRAAEVVAADRAEAAAARWAAAVAASASSSRTLDLASSATLAASPTKQ